MATILDALKDNDLDLRVTNGKRWLVFNNTLQEYIVYYRPPYSKKTKVLCQTDDETIAVIALTEEM